MNPINQFRRVAAVLLAALLMAAGAWAQSSSSGQSGSGQSGSGKTGKPIAIKPDPAGLAKNHRLILKDGTYQLVRQYTLAGDRVRYLSLERGEWEEMPADLVDWDATRKWSGIMPRRRVKSRRQP